MTINILDVLDTGQFNKIVVGFLDLMINEGFENLAKRIQNNMEGSATGGEYYGCIATGIKSLLKEHGCSEELKIMANELLDVIDSAYKN